MTHVLRDEVCHKLSILLSVLEPPFASPGLWVVAYWRTGQDRWMHACTSACNMVLHKYLAIAFDGSTCHPALSKTMTLWCQETGWYLMKGLASRLVLRNA